MIKTYKFKLLILLSSISVLCASDCFGQSSTERVEIRKDTTDITFSFRLGKYVLDSGFMNNMQSINRLNDLIESKNFASELDSIVIVASASPEGAFEFNQMLVNKRASAMKSFILWKHPQIDRTKLVVHEIAENWSGFIRMAKADLNLPMKSEVLNILEQEINPKTKLWRLEQLDKGNVWRYVRDNYFTYLRSSAASIVLYKKIVIPIKPEPKPIVEQPVIEQTPVEEPVVSVVEVEPKEVKTFLAVKTNLAAYIPLIANIGIEIPIGDKFSIDVPFYYSPYTVGQNYNFRVLALQPEFRFWLKEQMKGHFVGAYLMGGWYNIGFNDETRYQDRDGESPAWGGGLSYGYSMEFAKNWGLEFTLGLGYLRLDYDKFHNVINGQKYETKMTNYFGVNKLGITLIYKFKK